MRQITLSVLEYPTAKMARLRLHEEGLRINGPETFRAHSKPTMGVVIDKFKTEERFEEIIKQAPGLSTIVDGLSYCTLAGYRSYIGKHIQPRWGKALLTDIRPLEVSEWLNELPLASITQRQIRALFHLLLERAMLWGLIELQRNPNELVKLKGTSKRVRRPQIVLRANSGG
jgi:integrase